MHMNPTLVDLRQKLELPLLPAASVNSGINPDANKVADKVVAKVDPKLDCVDTKVDTKKMLSQPQADSKATLSPSKTSFTQKVTSLLSRSGKVIGTAIHLASHLLPSITAIILNLFHKFSETNVSAIFAEGSILHNLFEAFGTLGFFIGAIMAVHDIKHLRQRISILNFLRTDESFNKLLQQINKGALKTDDPFLEKVSVDLSLEHQITHAMMVYNKQMMVVESFNVFTGVFMLLVDIILVASGAGLIAIFVSMIFSIIFLIFGSYKEYRINDKFKKAIVAYAPNFKAKLHAKFAPLAPAASTDAVKLDQAVIDKNSALAKSAIEAEKNNLLTLLKNKNHSALDTQLNLELSAEQFEFVKLKLGQAFLSNFSLVKCLKETRFNYLLFMTYLFKENQNLLEGSRVTFKETLKSVIVDWVKIFAI